jgi:hypothetical protein
LHYPKFALQISGTPECAPIFPPWGILKVKRSISLFQLDNLPSPIKISLLLEGNLTL